MKVDGQCHCGQIRYEAQVDADKCGTPFYCAAAHNPQVYALPWTADITGLERSERA